MLALLPRTLQRVQLGPHDHQPLGRLHGSRDVTQGRAEHGRHRVERVHNPHAMVRPTPLNTPPGHWQQPAVKCCATGERPCHARKQGALACHTQLLLGPPLAHSE
jgi:hypothetical protein